MYYSAVGPGSGTAGLYENEFADEGVKEGVGLDGHDEELWESGSVGSPEAALHDESQHGVDEEADSEYDWDFQVSEEEIVAKEEAGHEHLVAYRTGRSERQMPWARFLKSLALYGYFSEANCSADYWPPITDGLVLEYGTFGDHKRALLKFARKQEDLLGDLPYKEMSVLLSDAFWDGDEPRKVRSARKRLQAYCSVVECQNSAVAEQVEKELGEATAGDLVRMCTIQNPLVTF